MWPSRSRRWRPRHDSGVQTIDVEARRLKSASALLPAPLPAPLPAFALLSFTYFAAIGLFNPYAPLWFKELGFSTFAIGGIAALQSCTRIVGPYGWGWLGDHTGQRVTLIRLACAGCVVSAFSLLFVESLWPVAAVTALLFLANSGVVPLYETSLAHLLSNGQGLDAGKYGRVRVWGSVGFIASVTAFGFVLDRAGVMAFPWVVAGMNLLLLWAALRLPRGHEEVAHDEPPPAVLQLLRQPEVAWFFASIFFTVLAHTAMYAFFSLYLVHLGYGKSAVGALWAVAVAVEILFFWTQGRFFSRLSPAGWLQVVAAVATARFAATAGAGHLGWVLVLAQVSHAVTFAAHHAACISLIHHLFPGRARGRGQALYTILGYGLSGVLGGFGGGWMIERLGYEPTFWAASAAAALGWLCARRCARALARAQVRTPA
jgi:PPP family 3-phenylpropionic acid transporter